MSKMLKKLKQKRRVAKFGHDVTESILIRKV